ncbi:MAG: AtpZ/AtpI family protein [Bryobacteraceae bacterium]|nr:AtpZ/AtpI family protein [Bryobacteraceae bacterium]MDW8379415.1 AtpZ/AtpI family protein [Bryobacterales bacterium]
MNRDRRLWSQFSRYSALATLLPAATFVGYLIGYFLDSWLGTTFLKIVFLLLGIASGITHLIRELTKEKP